MLILGIDPGGTTGVALLSINDKKASIEDAYNCKDIMEKRFRDLLAKADHIVCEDFKVRPGKARSGAFDYSNMHTPKVIGSIETLAKLLDKVVVLQQPAIKPMGYGFAHMKYVAKKQGTHYQDAACHAMYFAVKNGLCMPSKLL